MLYIAVCDDNTIDARFTARKINTLLGSNYAETECFSRSEELLSTIENCDYHPDIAVLDIKMGNGMDGIELAERLNTIVPDCAVIFLTGFAEYCSEVYRTDHTFFIDKARAEQYLPVALDKAQKQIKKRKEEPSLLHFSFNGTSYNVPADDVVYLERKLRKTMIVTQERQYSVTASPAELMKQFNDGSFIQCHQSYWVNCKYIEGINAQNILLRDGNQIPVSRSKAQSAKEAYFSILGKSLNV